MRYMIDEMLQNANVDRLNNIADNLQKLIKNILSSDSSNRYVTINEPDKLDYAHNLLNYLNQINTIIKSKSNNQEGNEYHRVRK